MRKRILYWLFGTDKIKDYMQVLDKNLEYHTESKKLIESYLETIKNYREDINNMRKLIVICEKHGIDVDKEIKQIEL